MEIITEYLEDQAQIIQENELDADAIEKELDRIYQEKQR